MESVITGKEPAQQGSALKALVNFYAGFNSANLDAVSDNWGNTDEVAMDNPLGGIRRGWQDIATVYQKLFQGPAKVYVEFYDYSLHQGEDMFFAVGRERGYFQVNGEQIDLAIRTSRIYQRRDGEWKQVHHHGSITDPDLLRRYQLAVLG